MRIFLDVTRLATRVLRSSPSGIDRVEYAYAKYLIEEPGVVGVFTIPVFSGALRRERALDILARVERSWRLDATAQEDPNFVALRAWLDSPVDMKTARPIRIGADRRLLTSLREADFFPLRDVLRAPARLERRMARDSAEPAIFFHASHAQLHKANLFAWLKKAGLRSAFFMHDAIPIDFPEFCSPGSYDRHVLRLETVSEHAALVIVNSQYSRDTIAAALNERRARVPDIEVLPLAVGSAFTEAGRAQGRLPEHPYFLFVGNIEPRKNILFLLEIWRRLVERRGASAPRLVIAGRRGWENENIVDVLERSRSLAPFISEASDLTDAGLARLMADARAVLSPSSAEGFGLPIAESLAARTPVVASDIAAHREVGGDHALFADVIDGPAWLSMIEALIEDDSPLRQERLGKITSYRPMTWKTHVEIARGLLERVGGG